MDKQETIAFKYLQSLGYSELIYEPDGNIPPDFLANENIAIEVRRLNQHIQNNGKNIPLENLEYKLIPKFVNLLAEFETTNFGGSAFAFLTFSRPIINFKKCINEIRDILKSHLASIKEHRSYQINNNLKIEFIPALNKLESPYVYGGNSDLDEGGFVISEIYKNIQIVIQEKTLKISKVRNKYPEWWLILIDYIGVSLSNEDTIQLNELKIDKGIWDKVVLVSPVKHEHGIEI